MNRKWMFGLMTLALIAAAFLSHPGSALAQSFPTKPISFICPFPPGTGNDVIARTIADKLSKSLGKVVMVENKAGATGAIAADAAAKAPADGHTIIIASTTLSINMSVSKVTYDLV